MKKGATTIVTVLVILIAVMFVIVTWQSRILLSIFRYQSLADIIAASYAAESETYDWIARFKGNYTNLFTPPLDDNERMIKNRVLLADNTLLSVIGRSQGGTDTLQVIAERPYATTRLLLSGSWVNGNYGTL